MCVPRARAERDPNFIRADQPHASLPFSRAPPFSALAESFALPAGPWFRPSAPVPSATARSPFGPGTLRGLSSGGGFAVPRKTRLPFPRSTLPQPAPSSPSQCEIRQPLLKGSPVHPRGSTPAPSSPSTSTNNTRMIIGGRALLARLHHPAAPRTGCRARHVKCMQLGWRVFEMQNAIFPSVIPNRIFENEFPRSVYVFRPSIGALATNNPAVVPSTSNLPSATFYAR